MEADRAQPAPAAGGGTEPPVADDNVAQVVAAELAPNDESAPPYEASTSELGGPGVVSPWLPFLDEASGATYYYNQETQELSWTDPALSSQGSDASNNDRPFPDASSRPGSATQGGQPSGETAVKQQLNDQHDSDWPFSAIDTEITASDSARGADDEVEGAAEGKQQVELHPTSSDANVLLERKESRGGSSMLETDEDGDDILLLHNQMMENNKVKSTQDNQEDVAVETGTEQPLEENVGGLSLPTEPPTVSPGEFSQGPTVSTEGGVTPQPAEAPGPVSAAERQDEPAVGCSLLVPAGESGVPTPVVDQETPQSLESCEDEPADSVDEPGLTAAPTTDEDAVSDLRDVSSSIQDNESAAHAPAEAPTGDGVESADISEDTAVQHAQQSPQNSTETLDVTAPTDSTIAVDAQAPLNDPTAAVGSSSVESQTTLALGGEAPLATTDRGADEALQDTGPSAIPTEQGLVPTEDTAPLPHRVDAGAALPEPLQSTPRGAQMQKSRPGTADPNDAAGTEKSETTPPDATLSPAWVEAYDDQRGVTYYYDPATKAVSWDHPGGPASPHAEPSKDSIEPSALTTLVPSTEPLTPTSLPSLQPSIEPGEGIPPQPSKSHASDETPPSELAMVQAPSELAVSKPPQPSDSASSNPSQPSDSTPAPQPQSGPPRPQAVTPTSEHAPDEAQRTKAAAPVVSQQASRPATPSAPLVSPQASRPATPSPPLPVKPPTPAAKKQQQSRHQNAEAARAQAWARDVASWQRLYNEASNHYHAMVEQMQEAVAAREAGVAREAGNRDMLKRQFAALLSNNAVDHLSPWDVMSRNLVGVDLKRLLQDIIDDPAKHADVLPSSGGKAKPATAAEVQQQLMRVRNEDGDSLLHLAVWKGSLMKVKHLLSLGADVNLVDNSITKWTPLHEAARSGNVPMTKLLLSAGAAIAAPDASGDTALHWACRVNHSTIVKVLLHADPTFATLHAVNHKRKTPLDLAKKPTLRLFLQDILAMHHAKPTSLATARSSGSSTMMLKSGRSDKSIRGVYPAMRKHL